MSKRESDLSDPRIRAGVLLATAGKGGADLTPFVRGPDWLADPYFLSPGRKSLLTVFGAEHSLGGIAGRLGRIESKLIAHGDKAGQRISVQVTAPVGDIWQLSGSPAARLR